MKLPFDPTDESRRAALRSFLRARRGRLTPAVGGLPQGVKRRARGLRRDDVAEIAGVSLSWYARFELGQLSNVSDRLIDSVARALHLDETEHQYLRALARPLQRPAERTDDDVPDMLRFVVESFTGGPAILLGARLDPLVVNDITRRIEPAFSVPGLRSNLAWLVFVDQAFDDRYANSDERRRDMAAMLRYSYAQHVGEREYDELIAAISERSPAFVSAWNDFEVKPIRFDGLNMRIGGENMMFSAIILTASEAPGKSVVFLRPADQKRFDELIGRLPPPRSPAGQQRETRS